MEVTWNLVVAVEPQLSVQCQSLRVLVWLGVILVLGKVLVPDGHAGRFF